MGCVECLVLEAFRREMRRRGVSCLNINERKMRAVNG